MLSQSGRRVNGTRVSCRAGLPRGVLADGEGHDPEDHAKGGEEATGQAFLGEQAAAQERPDEDANLAGGLCG